MVIFMMD